MTNRPKNAAASRPVNQGYGAGRAGKPIPPDLLSGGLKTLISIYKRPDLHFDATSCGPNCAKWLLEIGNREEVTVELGYIMPFDESVSFEIRIVNTGKVVDNIKHLTYSAMPYL